MTNEGSACVQQVQWRLNFKTKLSPPPSNSAVAAPTPPPAAAAAPTTPTPTPTTATTTKLLRLLPPPPPLLLPNSTQRPTPVGRTCYQLQPEIGQTVRVLHEVVCIFEVPDSYHCPTVEDRNVPLTAGHAKTKGFS